MAITGLVTLWNIKRNQIIFERLISLETLCQLSDYVETNRAFKEKWKNIHFLFQSFELFAR